MENLGVEFSILQRGSDDLGAVLGGGSFIDERSGSRGEEAGGFSSISKAAIVVDEEDRRDFCGQTVEKKKIETNSKRFWKTS